MGRPSPSAPAAPTGARPSPSTGARPSTTSRLQAHRANSEATPRVGLRLDNEASRDSDRVLVISVISCTPRPIRQLKGGDDVIRYLGPLCLCISTVLLSHYQYIKPVLSILALF